MQLKFFFLGFSLIGAICSCQDTAVPVADLSQGTWIDLSYPFDDETIYWPTDTSGFRIDTLNYGHNESYFYSAFAFCSAEHGGTHLDAPVHFAEAKKSVDELALDQLIGSAIVVDVSSKALANPDYQVSISDFEDWEAQHGPMPTDAIILIKTGYGQYWPDRAKYLGTDNTGPEAIPLLHFPGLGPETAEWLTSERTVKAIGLDTPSIDFGQSTGFEAHRILFEHDIPAFENLANLDQLPNEGAWVIALPMYISGGSGAPLRAVAFIPS